jgi:RND superfamily putative drug exporter
MLARIATICFVHRWRVLLAWIALLVVAVTAGATLGGSWASSATLKGTDSQAAYNLLGRHFPTEAGEQDAVLFTPVSRHRGQIDTWLAGLRHRSGVAAVDSLQRAPHHDIAAATFFLAAGNGAEGTAANAGHAAVGVEAYAAVLRRDGLTVAFNGDSFESGSSPKSEVVGIIAGLIVLLIVLGSVVAAGLPIVLALAGVGLSVPIIAVIAHGVPTPSFTDQVAAMIGIGVGIDYTLLVVTRFRTALARLRLTDRRPTGAYQLDAHQVEGHQVEDLHVEALHVEALHVEALHVEALHVKAAVVEAITSAGRSVVIAGCTVMVAMGGLFLMDVDIYDGVAVGCALAVAAAVAATLTLLPALLGFAGARIGRAERRVSLNASRLVRLVQRRPAGLATGGLLVLAVLASPIFSMHLAQPDDGTDPVGSTTRSAYALTSAGFGPGATGPIVIAAEISGARPGATTALVAALRRQSGVASVGPVATSGDGRAATVTVIPEWDPSSPQTAALVARLRVVVAGPTDRRWGLVTHVGGETASDIDFAHSTTDRLPWLIGGVLLLSFLLLLVSFRSVPIAAQAIVGNLFSVGAAYGVLVAVFQWGWGAGLIGAHPAPIAPWIPPMLFAIVFGLSMDYEVFLIGAIREARLTVGDGPEAVGRGLAGTARIITAAAVIMTLVFGSFVTSDNLGLKTVGLGLAVAIVVDATVIRLLVVPAVLTLLGPAAWWMPARGGWRRRDRSLSTLRVVIDRDAEGGEQSEGERHDLVGPDGHAAEAVGSLDPIQVGAVQPGSRPR